MSKFGRAMTYLLTALVGAAVALGAVIYSGAAFGGQPQQSTKLQELESIIDTYFIGEKDPTAMEDAAAAAMVNSLGDRWSHYISAQDYTSYMAQMDNSYVGVGMTVAPREEMDGIAIQLVNEGGPAEEAGILPGDVLVQVDGQDVAGMDLAEVRNLVVGTEGTQVKLTVRRKDGDHSYTVTRKHFDTPVAWGEMLEPGLGLVTIANFNARCAKETVAAIEALLDQGATALIFDVRNNPGGYKDELVNVLDYLLPEGVIFRSENFAGKIEEDRSDADCLDIPMAVLVNGDSYSAAEFFAAALREYEAARVVGQPTCGKGYFQTTFRMTDGSAVGLSIGKYYTPKGVSLAGVGLTPDVPVAVAEETALGIYTRTLSPEEDPQIQAAADLLRAG